MIATSSFPIVDNGHNVSKAVLHLLAGVGRTAAMYIVSTVVELMAISARKPVFPWTAKSQRTNILLFERIIARDWRRHDQQRATILHSAILPPSISHMRSAMGLQYLHSSRPTGFLTDGLQATRPICRESRSPCRSFSPFSPPSRPSLTQSLPCISFGVIVSTGVAQMSRSSQYHACIEIACLSTLR